MSIPDLPAWADSLVGGLAVVGIVALVRSILKFLRAKVKETPSKQDDELLEVVAEPVEKVLDAVSVAKFPPRK